MGRAKKSQPAKPAFPSASRNDVTLKLAPDAKLSVTVLTPDKPAQPLNPGLRWLLIGFGLGSVFWLWVNWQIGWLPSETLQPLEFREANLAVAVTYPNRATYQDELELLLHVTNRGAEACTGNVSLVFLNGAGAAPAYPLPAESATARLDKLAAGTGQAHRLKFALRQAPRWFSRTAVATELRVTTDKTVFPPQAGPLIPVTWLGLPLRALNAWLGNSIVLGGLAALVWEVVRKRLLGWEAKG